jgi:cation diffusion facilitator CzcD-associated flavoprotein CzcO
VTFDVVIIGAGISGLYQLYTLRKLGLSVRVIEEAGDVGGTWYWNRYPGARFDSESYTYGYSFSSELLQDWSWSEHFAAQPETLRYLNHVADRFDLRRDIQFNSRVGAARYVEKDNCWELELEDGGRVRGRFLITALGLLSAHTPPRVEGRDTFKGEAYHTARWPHHPVSFEGKRVGVIGTGATGIQVIQTIAPWVKQLTVFQRNPNYVVPLFNGPITDEEQKDIKSRYAEIFAACRRNAGQFMHPPDPRSLLEVSPEEREAKFDKLYYDRGMGLLQGNFRDITTNREANAIITDYVKRKMRERIKDPAVAEKLIPKNHTFGTRRLPLETNYLEAYNRDNVKLVDLKETPIERITETSVKTSDAEYELDMLIYATGFDAITGAFDRIDIRGRDNVSLKEKWAEGPVTYLGLTSAGFPNMFTIIGPHNAGVRCNVPRCIEQNVEWIADFMRYVRDNDITTVEATVEAENEWTHQVRAMGEGMLFFQIDSFLTGINTNVDGKTVRRVLQYLGGAPQYRAKCDEVAASGYEGFTLTRAAERLPASRRA